MPDVEVVEVVTGEYAVAIQVPASSLTLEVNLEQVAKVGAVGDTEVVEVTIPGTLKVPDDNHVFNVLNAPGLMVLNVGDPVPGGTPAGTVILRK